jgi:hypothetical protein
MLRAIAATGPVFVEEAALIRQRTAVLSAVFLCLIVVIPMGARLIYAQSTTTNPLATIKSLKCKFPVYAVVSWKNGQPEAQVKQAQMFSLDFDEIDADDGTARVTSTSGATHITALLTVSSLHLMERSVTGTLNITTVFSSEKGATTFRAVHSRHDYLPMSIPGFVSEPTVSQNYGECVPGK